MTSAEIRLFYDRTYRAQEGDVIDHKLQFSAFCMSHGIATAETLAILRGDSLFADETLELPPCDLFSKPVNAFRGEGTILWVYDKTSADWVHQGSHYDSRALLSYLDRVAASYGKSVRDRYFQMLQPRIISHPILKDISPRALNTARIYTIRHKDKPPFLFLAHLRICSDADIIDTASFYAAPIDMETGRLGVAKGMKSSLGNVDVHPLTGRPIKDLLLPDWDTAKNLVINAHWLAPPLPIIGWDVAFSSNGPLIMEGNTCSQIEASQVANEQSFAQDKVVDALLSWIDEDISRP